MQTCFRREGVGSLCPRHPCVPPRPSNVHLPMWLLSQCPPLSHRRQPGEGHPGGGRLHSPQSGISAKPRRTLPRKVRRRRAAAAAAETWSRGPGDTALHLLLWKPVCVLTAHPASRVWGEVPSQSEQHLPAAALRTRRCDHRPSVLTPS